MNNTLQPFDQNWDEAVVPVDEEIGDGMLAASSYNTLVKISSLMPDALEMQSSTNLPE